MRINIEPSPPNAVMRISCFIVGASTLLYGPEIALRGWLSYFIALLTTGLLETIIPGNMSQWQNPYGYMLFFSVAVGLNVALFSLLPLAIVRVYQKVAPGLGSFLIIAWLIFYLLLFVVLFEPSQLP